MPDDGALLYIDDADRVDTGFRHIEKGCLAVDSHPGWDHAAETSEGFGRRELNGLGDLERADIKGLDGVVVCICHPEGVPAHEQCTWGAATDGLPGIRGGVNEDSRLCLPRDGWLCSVTDIVCPNRLRIRDAGGPKTLYEASFSFNAAGGFFAWKAKRRNTEATLAKGRPGLWIRNEGVVENTDVGNKQPAAIFI